MAKITTQGQIIDSPQTDSTYEELAKIFHRTVAQLLLLLQRAKRDIQTPVHSLQNMLRNQTLMTGTNWCDVMPAIFESHTTHETHPAGR